MEAHSDSHAVDVSIVRKPQYSELYGQFASYNCRVCWSTGRASTKFVKNFMEKAIMLRQNLVRQMEEKLLHIMEDFLDESWSVLFKEKDLKGWGLRESSGMLKRKWVSLQKSWFRNFSKEPVWQSPSLVPIRSA